MKFLAKAILFTAIAGASTALFADDKVESGDALKVKLQDARARIEVDYGTIWKLHLSAQKSGDAIKLNCVNDKLVMAKAEAKIADLQFQAAIGAPDQAALDMYASKAADIQKLRESAQGCIDSKKLSTEANNSFSTDGIIPPTIDPEAPDYYIEPGAYATPDD